MQRRKFLRRAALLPLPFLLGGGRLSALTSSFLETAVDPNDDRVLVLLQLNGGNDGLNTVVPVDQYDALNATRGNVLIPQAQLLSITDTLAFHPAMTQVQRMYGEGQVGIIQGVGYTNQNRSHFRSTDIWNTGSTAETVLTTGWLGRHLDSRFPGYPQDYPNTEQPDPFAIVMGTSVSETCQGSAGNFSLAINNVDNVGQLPVFDGGADLSTPYGRELDWLRTTTEQSNQYAAGIQSAVGGGATMATYPENNEVAAKLRDVARLISGGLGTKIYIVELGGFDTHANQSVEGEPTTGTHANLLQTLSDAIGAFQQDLVALGISRRVVGMTYSEFGRRIRSNASQGTDHGDAAPLFLFGDCVNAGIVGANADIHPDVDVLEGVAMQYDFRNVYGSVLVDWFGVEAATVTDNLIDDFTYIPLLNGCNSVSTSRPPVQTDTPALTAAPNPFGNTVQLGFTTDNERARLSIYDGLGRQVRVVSDQQFAAGEHQLTVDLSGLPSGPYHVHLMLSGGRRATRRVVKR